MRYLDDQRDMAEELFQGCVASEMDICEAMARNILPQPKYVITTYSYEDKLKQYSERIGHLKNTKQINKTEKILEKLRRALQMADGLDVIFQKHMPKKNSKVIIFCTRTEHMMEIIAKYLFEEKEEFKTLYEFMNARRST